MERMEVGVRPHLRHQVSRDLCCAPATPGFWSLCGGRDPNMWRVQSSNASNNKKRKMETIYYRNCQAWNGNTEKGHWHKIQVQP
jgi:hypothetical protein